MTLVKQYCELANRVWCNGDAKKCDRPGGSIYAHSAGAMTLLEGIKTGYCKKDMKFNVIGAPLKGLTIGESLKKYDSWCSRESMSDKYFSKFFNDISKKGNENGNRCGRKITDFVSNFKTSVGKLTKTMFRRDYGFKAMKPSVLKKVRTALLEVKEKGVAGRTDILRAIKSLDEDEQMHMYTKLYHAGRVDDKSSEGKDAMHSIKILLQLKKAYF